MRTKAVCAVLSVLGCGPKDVMVPIPQTAAYVGDVSTGKARVNATKHSQPFESSGAMQA